MFIVNQVIGRQLCGQVDYTPQDWLGGDCVIHMQGLNLLKLLNSVS